MMKKTMNRIGFFVSIFMAAAIWFSSFVYPAVPVTNSGTTGSPQSNRQAASQRTVKRSAEFLKSIKGNVLYTDTNSYSLQNVRITYVSAKPGESTSPNGKKVVDLMFLDDILKEVVIHQ
jgi:hypothetical protein